MGGGDIDTSSTSYLVYFFAGNFTSICEKQLVFCQPELNYELIPNQLKASNTDLETTIALLK